MAVVTIHVDPGKYHLQPVLIEHLGQRAHLRLRSVQDPQLPLADLQRELRGVPRSRLGDLARPLPPTLHNEVLELLQNFN